MRGRVLVVLLALASLRAVISPSLDPAPSPAASSPYPLPGGERDQLGGTVGRVGDGDTIYARLPNGGGKARYIRADTPERHHPARGEEPPRRGTTHVTRPPPAPDPSRLPAARQPP